MLAPLTDDTDPGLPKINPEADLTTAVLRLQTAVDQLTQPERVTLDRMPDSDEEASRREHEQANLYAQFKVARAHQDDQTRSRIERRVAEAQARKLAAQIVAIARVRVELPPLLARVRDAVESSTNTGQVTSTTHPAPIGLAAAELLGAIERVVGRGDPTLIPQVRHWAASALVWRTTAPTRLLEAVVLAQSWVSECRQLMDPDRRYLAVRDAVCPACGRAHAYTVVDGDRVRQPALLIDTKTGRTVCLVCDEVWPFERGAWLSTLLEQQREERRARRAQES